MRSAGLLGVALCTLAPAIRADDATPVSIDAGATRNLCAAGVVACPVSTFMCDDPKIAVVENGPAGAVLKGIAPGTTLCAIGAAAGTFRRVLRVTVRPAEGGAPER
jgi:hypothetical protein